VLVLDERGAFVIPLLSGHEGGANDWAYQVSLSLKNQLIITSASPYLKPVYSIGMGCERDCTLVYLEELMLSSLKEAGLSIAQIDSFHSIDIKADEVNLIALAKKYHKPFRTWSIAELSPMKRLLSTHSNYIFNTVGVYGVAESACLVGCQKLTNTEPELVLNKHKNAKATCAIARSFPGKSIN
jgi:cobalt-precorrin 5A hydrolase